jgi:hypothetical protein
MSQARYAFWRGPDGKPLPRNREDVGPQELLDRIYRCAKVANDGTVVWHSFNMLRDPPLLQQSIVLKMHNGVELNDTDAERISLDAIKEVRKAGHKTISPDAYLQALDQLVAIHQRKPSELYLLRTSLSVAELPFRRISLRGCTIRWLKDPKHYVRPAALNELKGTALWEHGITTHYMPIVIRTSGKTVHEAIEKGMESLSLLRGLWNFRATLGSWTRRLSYSPPAPLAVIHSGPVHTLHRCNGKPAINNYWYEPGHTGDQTLFKKAANWASLSAFIRKAPRVLSANSLRAEVEQLFIRYIQALDRPDEDSAFIRLWNILETMTDTGRNNYDVTITRAVWIYEKPRTQKEELQLLRIRRNRLVHSSGTSHDGGISIGALKGVVDDHLRFLLFNPFKVRSLQEYSSLLSQPRERPVLLQKKSVIAAAMRFHFRKHKPE